MDRVLIIVKNAASYEVRNMDLGLAAIMSKHASRGERVRTDEVMRMRIASYL